MTIGSGPITIATTPAFSIGPMQIIPPARELSVGASRETIEPRVMQVLIALAEQHGSVVSRDVLIDRCWGGRAISEDALNRVIAKLRRIAAGIGQDSFSIQTVTKVGYRLALAERDEAVRAALPARPKRRSWTASTAWLLFSAMSLAAVLTFRRAQHKPVIEPSHSLAAPLAPAATDLETRGLSLVFQGTEEQTEEGIQSLRQATAIVPQHASTWGSLAMAYVLALPFANSASTPQLVMQARGAANRARNMDPRDGRSLAALISLQPMYRNWIEQDVRLRQALEASQRDTPPLVFQRVQFLASVGRTKEALTLVEHLVTVSPLVPWIQSCRVNLLAAEGRIEEAQQVADHAAQTWPRNPLIWFTRFNLALYGGRPKDALAIAEMRSLWPAGQSRAIEAGVEIAHALIDGSSEVADRVIDRLAAHAGDDRISAEMAVQAAAALGRNGRALALARQMYGNRGVLKGRGMVMPRVGYDDGHERNTALLFILPLAQLRSNPDFAALVREIGMYDYWQRANVTPTARASK